MTDARTRGEWAGWAAVALLVLAVGVAFLSLAFSAGEGGGVERPLWDAYLGRVLLFTVAQAALSTLLSVGFAVPLARALSRRASFPGRAFLLRLMSLPMALPALVAVLGIVTVWGRAGWANGLLSMLGAQGRIDIYGLAGILIGHVFFNLPLAARMLLARIEAIPGEIWRNAAQLGMGSGAIFRAIEWPAIRAALPGIASIVFMLCATSFTVVLTLGGGPAASTLEVAIYQALRFDFDPARAVALAATQIALSAVLVLVGAQLTVPMAAGASLGRTVERPDRAGTTGRLADGAAISLAAAFTGLPLLATLASGFGSPLIRVLQQAALWQALATSIVIAALASILALPLACALVLAANAARRRRARFAAALLSRSGSLILVVPPMALGAGWFMALHRIGQPQLLAPALVAGLNGLMALPYAVQVLEGALESLSRDHDRLCDSLGIKDWARLRLIDWPVLRRPAGFALALAAALSIGDLGVIALFGSESFITLPLLLQQRMGSYRVTDAAGIALVLGALCFALLFAGERVARSIRGGSP